MKIIYLIISLMAMLVLNSYANDYKKEIYESIVRQRTTHPMSTLKDFYKSFFQDKYGTGHIVPDTVDAGDYLRKEMSSYVGFNPNAAARWIEKTGWGGTFYRIDLAVVKSGIVPCDVFLEAFYRSAQDITLPSLEDWGKEWEEIESVIRSMNLSLPDYEAELDEIKRNLEQGNYIGHHSDRYEKAYSPHYRIIKWEMYEELIYPYMK
ncbi:MAG: hypothetical protein LBH04_08585 [Tannerellaceae bacterium]|jgi:hypothetical protein|nr:hypothetical protein [Tannerellaceae bacterium]